MAHLTHLPPDEQRRYVASAFTRIIRRYDLVNDVMTLWLVRRWRAEVARLATKELAGPVLDVASGTGSLTLELASRGAQVVGLDLTARMVRWSHARAPDDGSSQVGFIVGDALALPFRGDTFGAVTCAFGLRNMPDVSAALKEMVRVLRPDGRVVLLEIMPPEKGMCVVRRAIWVYLRRVVPVLGALLARDRAAYDYLRSSVASFFAPAELTSLMEAAGLTSVSYRTRVFGAVAIHTGVKPA